MRIITLTVDEDLKDGTGACVVDIAIGKGEREDGLIDSNAHA